MNKRTTGPPTSTRSCPTPSTFLTASDPRIFGNDEVIIHDQSNDTTSTPDHDLWSGWVSRI